jgi:hypothetical protein
MALVLLFKKIRPETYGSHCAWLKASDWLLIYVRTGALNSVTRSNWPFPGIIIELQHKSTWSSGSALVQTVTLHNEAQRPYFTLQITAVNTCTACCNSTRFNIELTKCTYMTNTLLITLREERRLKVVENRVPRRIFGPNGDEVTGE